jgi:Mrp family chromosome partitioning ATPase
VQSLRQQESTLAAHLAAADSKFGPQHPLPISLRSQLSEVRSKIAAETKRVAREATGRVGPLEYQAAALERARGELQARIQEQGASAARLKQLQRDADDARSIYTAFAIFRAKTDGAPQVARSNLEILTPANPSPLPAWPNRKAVLFLAGLGTLGLGLLLSFLRASLDQGLRSSEQVGALLGLETVALIPRARGYKSRRDPAGALLHAPDSALADSVSHFYAAITTARAGREHYGVLVTSALPGEGKTTTSLMLARQAALMGEKTLLVRLDLRDAGAMQGEHDSDSVDISQEKESGLYVLSVRTRRHDSLKVLCLFSFWEKLRRACVGYDLIIIDSPPLLSIPDAKMIARFAQIDMTIFVVKWGATKVAAVSEALRQLRSASTEAPRIVLAQMDSRRYAEYCYGRSSLRAAYPRKYSSTEA